jgi:hypothetical protein
MTTSDRAPTPEQARRLKAQELAAAAFIEVERRFGRGLSFDEAKREVLEERAPAALAEHGEEVADALIHLVMAVTPTGLHPASRRRHWTALAGAHAARGGAPPSAWERKLFDWFGRIPPRLRR